MLQFYGNSFACDGMYYSLQAFVATHLIKYSYLISDQVSIQRERIDSFYSMFCLPIKYQIRIGLLEVNRNYISQKYVFMYGTKSLILATGRWSSIGHVLLPAQFLIHWLVNRLSLSLQSSSHPRHCNAFYVSQALVTIQE